MCERQTDRQRQRETKREREREREMGGGVKGRKEKRKGSKVPDRQIQLVSYLIVKSGQPHRDTSRRITY